MDVTHSDARDARAERLRAGALADVRRLLAGIGRSIVLSLILVLPVALRLACAGAALAGAVYAAPRAWSAFGADVVALLPATAVVLLPLAAGQNARLSWGGLLVSGAVTAGIGALLEAVTPLTRALFVVAALATVVYYYQSPGERSERGERGTPEEGEQDE